MPISEKTIVAAGFPDSPIIAKKHFRSAVSVHADRQNRLVRNSRFDRIERDRHDAKCAASIGSILNVNCKTWTSYFQLKRSSGLTKSLRPYETDAFNLAASFSF